MGHTIGKPIYKKGDTVEFGVVLNCKERYITGTVIIVDAFGTFEQNDEPSYDILVDNWPGYDEPVLVKHILESNVKSKRN